VRLVPVGKPTFPDQQQDLQNAADASLAIEYDRSVKFAELVVGWILRRFGCWEEVRVGWGVSEVQ
jgi:hypothetical protein